MRSDAIVIVGVGFQDPTQMHLAQDNDVVHTFTPDRSDQPFHKAILQGEAGAIGLSRMPMARSRRVTTCRRSGRGLGSCNREPRAKERPRSSGLQPTLLSG